MSRARVAVAALLLAACSFGGNGAQDRQLAELRYNQRTWQSAGVRDYQYTFQVTCFCGPDWTNPRVITVHDGVLASVTDSLSGQPSRYSRPSESPTVDSLFAMAERALQDDGAKVTVRYDQALGFPSSIALTRENVADGDYAIVARSFRRITP